MLIGNYEDLKSAGNIAHVENYIAHYADAIDKDDELRKVEQGYLYDAANYYAWLNATSEHVQYLARVYIFRKNSNPKTFDFNYKTTVDFLQSKCVADIGQESINKIVTFLKIRHILVHKGFPNPHSEPSSNNRPIVGGQIFTLEDVRDVSQRISHAVDFQCLKNDFDDVKESLSNSLYIE